MKTPLTDRMQKGATLFDGRKRLGKEFDELKQSIRAELEPLPKLALKIILFLWPFLREEQDDE